MRIILAAAITLTTLGMTTASFAQGATGATGTPDNGVSTYGTMNETTGTTNGTTDTMGTSGSSGNATWGSGNSAAENTSPGTVVYPPGGGKGGYPARLSDGCLAPGTPQDTGSSRGRNC
jgi:hypothetical protein